MGLNVLSSPFWGPLIDISRAQAINGWMSDIELTWLAQRAKESEVIVEFGSFHGRSTRALADNTDGIVYAVDPWDGVYFDENGDDLPLFSPKDLEQFCRNLGDHIKNLKVIPFIAKSKDFVMAFQKANLIFLDGDHHYEVVKADIKLAQELCLEGGIIAGHDYGRPDWPGVKRAVDELFRRERINVLDTIWWVVNE